MSGRHDTKRTAAANRPPAEPKKGGLRGQRARILRFILIFIVVTAAGVWLENYLTRHNSAKGYRNVVAASGCWIARCLGSDATATGSRIKAGYRSLEVTPECAGIDAISVFCAGVIALPCPIRKKLLGLLLGLIGVPILNVFRIAALVWISQWQSRWFDPTHDALMHLFPLLAVLPLWLLWLWFIIRRSQDSGTTKDKSPAQALVRP